MPSERLRPARRVPRRVVALIAGLVIVYILVIVLYAVSSRLNTTGLSDEAPADSIGVTLRAESVNAVGNRLGMTIDLTSRGRLNDDGALSAPVSVIVTENDGPRVIEFASETLTSSVSLSLMTSGYVELWPFDSYRVATTVVAATGLVDDAEPLKTHVNVVGGVPGWALEAHPEDLGATVTDDDRVKKIPSVVITATRSGATIAFGIVLLTLMIVMPVLVLTVALLAFTGRRKVEATMMSWSAAMLFATIPLRTFLPGSPPIGSWIDFLIVLWVIVGLVVGLTIYVAAWVRWSPKLRSEPQP